MPSFGGTALSGKQVLRFYGAWAAFTTQRSFAGVDKYDTREVSSTRRQWREEGWSNP